MRIFGEYSTQGGICSDRRYEGHKMQNWHIHLHTLNNNTVQMVLTGTDLPLWGSLSSQRSIWLFIYVCCQPRGDCILLQFVKNKYIFVLILCNIFLHRVMVRFMLNEQNKHMSIMSNKIRKWICLNGFKLIVLLFFMYFLCKQKRKKQIRKTN